MRILVVGAGAIGGYFGGRLLQAGCDVSFLVRAQRAATLAKTGLVIKSATGDFARPAPPTILAEDLREPFDLILLSVKAYDLDGAIASFASAVGSQTAILPLLNGMRHLDILDQRFGPDRVLGGQCLIAATIGKDGAILHLNQDHALSFGERDGSRSERIEAIAAAMSGAAFDSRASERILQEMWEKWVFLAALAGSTCLMRAAIGDIAQSPGGTDFVLALFDECRAIAVASRHAPREVLVARSCGALTARGSTLTASMLRDIENRAPIEADHILGDLLRRAPQPDAAPLSLLHLAYAHLKAYEARRQREAR